MKTTTRRAAVLVATGALGLGGIAVAAPAVAGAGPFGNSTVAASDPGPGRGGGGAGPHADARMGTMARDGSCLDTGVAAAQGKLTEQQQAILAKMAQEEKLAHDLYAEFAAAYPVPIFDRIAAAEARHLTAVRTLLDRYGIADPTAGLTAGEFAEAAVQANYDRLLAEGQASQAAALQVGRDVEQADIADLQDAQDGVTAPDVKQVYSKLLTASKHHLTAFTRWSVS